MSTAKQGGWLPRHFELHNGLTDGRLQRSVHVELPKYMFDDTIRKQKVISLRRSLHRLKQVARTWNALITNVLKTV